MITLDQYKQLLTLTNSQYEQARQLIDNLIKQGILLPMGDDFIKPERLLFDSQDNYQNRKGLYSVLRFRQHTIGFELEHQVAALLSELDVTPETTQEVHSFIGQMLLETKPYITQHYLNLGSVEPEFRATEFNMVLMYHIRTSFNGWVISAAETVRIRSNDQAKSDQFVAMFKEHFPTDSQAGRLVNWSAPVTEDQA